MTKAKIGFFGAVDAVTGSNFLFEVPSGGSETGKRILIDCGLFQGEQFADDRNREKFYFDPASIDVLLVSHAHIDHIGRIPKLVKEGFHGVVYSTQATMELAKIMLLDTVRIMQHEATAQGKSPIYEEQDVLRAMELWQAQEYYKPFALTDQVQVEMRDAGHMLGSAMMFITLNGKTMVFTGDLGNSPTPLLRDTDPITGATYLLTESVYGDRNHEGREERKEKMKEVIERTIKTNGTLIIPVFTIERTQELLFELNELIEHHKLHEVPVFVDSPLAIKATEIYEHHTNIMNETARGLIKKGDDIFKFPRLTFTETKQQSVAIWEVKGPKVIMGGSGMLNGGRVVHHVKHYAHDPNSTIMFVGYQAVGTAGRKMIEGERTVRLFGEETHIRSHVEVLNGYSGHKDSEHLLQFIATGAETLKRVYVAIGEPKASMFLAQRIRDYLGLEAIVPEPGRIDELEF
jgi:metallo-beta-lactamase family protein